MGMYDDVVAAINLLNTAYNRRFGGNPATAPTRNTAITAAWYNANNGSTFAKKTRYSSSPYKNVSSGDVILREHLSRLQQVAQDIEDNRACESCANSCLGSCSGTCTGGCSGTGYGGCVGDGCAAGCSGCTNNCSGSPAWCSCGSGCYGCSGDCRNACSACSGCSGGCVGCTGCASGCGSTCYSGCSQSCTSGCSNSARIGGIS